MDAIVEQCGEQSRIPGMLDSPGNMIRSVKQLAEEVKRLRAELATAKDHPHRERQEAEPTAIERYDRDVILITGTDAVGIDECPYCKSGEIDQESVPEIFDGSGYFGYMCNACKGYWTIVGTIDRILVDRAEVE